MVGSGMFKDYNKALCFAAGLIAVSAFVVGVVVAKILQYFVFDVFVFDVFDVFVFDVFIFVYKNTIKTKNTLSTNKNKICYEL